MAQTQLIKRRIRSVTSTRQITKALELVSASKLRRAQEASLRTATYTNSAREILQRLSQLTDAAHHPLFLQHDTNRRLFIFFTSDRGMAGAYTSNLIKTLTAELAASDSSKIIVIGNQGARFVSRLEGVDVIGAYNNWPAHPTSVDVRPIIETAIALFTEAEIDTVDLVYTRFQSTLLQTAVTQRLLPVMVDPEASVPRELAEAVFEPSPAEVLTAMMPRLIESQVLGAALNAVASEQAMRMMAMKSASDNAGDIIEDLTLEYNGARQAGITQELAEITGGAEAIA